MKGFTHDMLAKIDEQLPSAFDISFVFNRFTLGDGFLKNDARHPRGTSSRRPASTS